MRDDSSAELFWTIQENISSLETTVYQQHEKIQNLESSSTNYVQPRNSISRASKASAISAYSGKKEERNSLPLRAFFYNVKQVGKMCCFQDEMILEIAEFRLQGKAATWMESLEHDTTKPTTLEGLRSAVFKDFVSANEKNKVKVKLMNLKMKRIVEEHIFFFHELVNISQTPRSELYHQCFMRLSNSYKEHFTKEFPDQQPADIHDAYELASTLDMAATWRMQDKPALQGNKEENPGDSNKDGYREKSGPHESNDLET